MEFLLNDEQRMLQASVRRLLADTYAPTKASPLGYHVGHWITFAEQGWLGAGVLEANGGLGGGLEMLALIGEEFGRALVREAFVSVAVVAAELLQALAPEHPLLERLMTGDARPVLAHFEPQSLGDERWVETRAIEKGGGYRLTGAKSAVLGGPAADVLLVTARTGEEALTVFAVAPDAEGLTRQDYRTVDNRGASNLTLDDVHVDAAALVGKAGAAEADVRRALDHGVLVAASECVGAMDATLAMSRDYLNTRKQFGRLIGDFQVLRHRLADMYIEAEQARAIVFRALAEAHSGEPDEQSRLASAAKVRVSQAGHYVTTQAIQLHGGIGMTEELMVGHYFKRLTMFSLMGGADAAHLERYIRLGQSA